MNQPKPLPLNFVLRTWGGSYLIVGKTVRETRDLQEATVYDGAIPLADQNALFQGGYHRHVDHVPVLVTRTVFLKD